MAALRAAGAQPQIAVWDDAQVDWRSFELVLLRSAWDYAERRAQFLAWARRTAQLTRLANSWPIVRWNTDKHYLQQLAAAGVPVVPSRFIEPGEDAAGALQDFLETYPEAELVVKPAVGAGSRDAQRHARAQRARILAHVQRLLVQGRSVLLQPFLERVGAQGETALVFIGGRFSHAVRKGLLLQSGAAATPSLFAPEEISARAASSAELQVAAQALAAVPEPALLYARVDLIRDAQDAPRLLELELTEPSLFFAHHPGSAEALARASLGLLGMRAAD